MQVRPADKNPRYQEKDWNKKNIPLVEENQVSALALILFNIFMYDQDDGAGCAFSKFPDYTKPGGVADMPEGHVAIERNFNRLEKWLDRNLKKFNKKCKIFNLGENNPRHEHVLGAT
ncbi:rna-directed dna polymerase from mobile element jockey-like [Pitangus sulphuratus]|nr:rna-directed dna polymerase from mobile element jockey-like [Pitangus sulphuratus]